MGEQPLVSILIPSYNSERYIRECLDSACAQTYQNIEIIVCDDGSTDTTCEIVRSYDTARIRLISKEHSGIARTRNRLLREARGEFFTYLDSDDIYLSSKVFEQAHFLVDHPEYALVYCDMLYFFDGRPSRLYHHTYTYQSGHLLKELLARMSITNTAIMFRRSVITEVGFYDEELQEVEDFPFFLAMAQRGMQFGYLDKRLVKYRLRRDSNTQFEIYDRMAEDALRVFDRVVATLLPAQRKEYGCARLREKKIFALAFAYIGRRRKRDALSLLLTFRPHSFRDGIFQGLLLCTLGVPGWISERVFKKIWRWRNEHHFIPIEYSV